jgi:hypothetical protein
MVAKVAQGMAREMQKSGLIEEMVEDAISMTEDPDLDELADEEVDACLFEITKGELGACNGPSSQLALKFLWVSMSRQSRAAQSAS